MANKCPCGKKSKQSLLVKCSNEDCEIGWWHSVCAGFTTALSKKSFENIGGWCCPVCVMNNLNIPGYTTKATTKFIDEIEKKLDVKIDDLQTEINNLKEVKEGFANVDHTFATQKQLWSDIVAGDKDGGTKSFVSTMAKQVVNHTNQVIVDRENRERNIIMFNAKESESQQSEERKEHDKSIFDGISRVVVGEVLPTDKIVRLGSKTTDNDGNSKIRPIKVCFSTVFDKRKFLSNLYKLGSAQEEFKTVRIQHDLSPDERELTKSLLAESYNKNESEKPDNFLYKVRGPPQAPRVVKVYHRTTKVASAI